jgi:CHASE3 domain sensor protein
VILEAEGILSSMNAAEAALKTSLLTGSDRDRAACRRAWAEIVEHLEVAKALTREEPHQHDQFLKIEPLIASRVKFSSDTIRAASENDAAAIRKLVSGDSDENREIQRRIELLIGGEQEMLRARDKESYLHAETTRRIVLAGGALNLGVLLFLIFLVKDDLAARRRAASVLAQSNTALEAAVRERTAELALANQSLADENLEQRWSNEALDHQLRYNQLIIDSVDDLIFVISKASNISRINSAVTRLTGFESQELVGKPLSQILGPGNSGRKETLSPLDAILASMKAGRDLVGAVGLLKTRNESAAEVTFNAFPLRDRDKVVGGVVSVRLAGSREAGSGG